MTVTNTRSTGVYNSKDIIGLSSLRNGPMIAAFWGDVDNRAGGEVSYRQTTAARDLTMATMLITERNERNNEPSDFIATSLMIATWQKVGYYKRHGDKVHVWHCALSIEGLRSIVG